MHKILVPETMQKCIYNGKIPFTMVKCIQYLGIVLMQLSTLFKCAYDNAKKLFYKSFDAIFGDIG